MFNLRNNERTDPHGRMWLLGKEMLGAFSSGQESNDQQLENNCTVNDEHNGRWGGVNDMHGGLNDQEEREIYWTLIDQYCLHSRLLLKFCPSL